jgi:hypothetical protein
MLMAGLTAATAAGAIAVSAGDARAQTLHAGHSSAQPVGNQPGGPSLLPPRLLFVYPFRPSR